MEDLVFLTQEEVECQAVDQLIQKRPESPEFGRILEPDELDFFFNSGAPSWNSLAKTQCETMS